MSSVRSDSIKRRWADAEYRGKPTRDERGRFVKGNPGGGRKKKPAAPVTLEWIQENIDRAWGVLWELAVERKDKSMLRLLLAYAEGQPVTRSTRVVDQRFTLDALTVDALKAVIEAAERARQLPEGEVLEGEVLDVRVLEQVQAGAGDGAWQEWHADSDEDDRV